MRKRSILREFSKRLQVIIEESHKIKRRIITIPGPWYNAINNDLLKHQECISVY